VPRTREASVPLSIAIRTVLAMLAVLGYLALRDVLDPGPAAAARFGLGILLFALLVDLGRSIAGTGPALRGHLGPHRQRADPQVDEAYEDLREALSAFLDRGELRPQLVDGLEQAAQARGLGEAERERLHRRLREAGEPHASPTSLLAVRLLSGFVATLGIGLASALLAEGLGMALFPPVLFATGTSLGMLQWRAHDAGARWIGLSLGLLGTGLFALGAARILSVSLVAGSAIMLVAAAGLAATIHATWTAPGRARIEADLATTVARLRRAFLLALLAGLVVFGLDPVFSALLDAAGLPTDALTDLARVLVATVLGFLAVETAGTWLTLHRESRRGPRERERRRQAVDAVLDELDRHRAPTPTVEDVE